MTSEAADLSLVRLLISQRRWDEALRAVGPFRRSHPSDPEVWHCQAEALLGANHPGEALAAARRWVDLAPDSTEAAALLHELEAEQALRAVVAAQSESLSAWTRQATSTQVTDAGRLHPSAPRPGPGPAGGAGWGTPPPGSRPRTDRPRKGARSWRPNRSVLGIVVVVALVGLVAYPRWRAAIGGGGTGGFPALVAQDLPTRDLSPAELSIPAEPPAKGQWKFLYEHDGKPVRHDPCHTIHYRVRIGPGPAGGVSFVEEGFRRLSEATGLQFVYDGPTDKVPQANERGSTDPDAPVTIAWATPDETKLLSPTPLSGEDPAGVGGPERLTEPDGSQRLAGGEVVLRVQPDLAPGFSGGASQGNLLLHELGHLVGLDHVEDPNEVMTPVMSYNALDGYGSGDLRGLWLLGAAQGCL